MSNEMTQAEWSRQINWRHHAIRQGDHRGGWPWSLMLDLAMNFDMSIEEAQRICDAAAQVGNPYRDYDLRERQ